MFFCLIKCTLKVLATVLLIKYQKSKTHYRQTQRAKILFDTNETKNSVILSHFI